MVLWIWSLRKVSSGLKFFCMSFLNRSFENLLKSRYSPLFGVCFVKYVFIIARIILWELGNFVSITADLKNHFDLLANNESMQGGFSGINLWINCRYNLWINCSYCTFLWFYIKIMKIMFFVSCDSALITLCNSCKCLRSVFYFSCMDSRETLFISLCFFKTLSIDKAYLPKKSKNTTSMLVSIWSNRLQIAVNNVLRIRKALVSFCFCY